MDQRLIVTVPFVVHLIAGVLFAVAYAATDAAFTAGQLEFLVAVGYVGTFVAMGLIWLRNHVRGAPLLVGCAGAACWFSVYFLFVHDNPANALAVTGEGATAYPTAAAAVILGFLGLTAAGCWLWYRESERFRATVDGFVRPPDSRR